MKTNTATKTAWNPSGIAWMSIFLGFFPAGILYAYNYARLGKKKLRTPLILIITLVFIGILFLLFTQENLNQLFFECTNIVAGLIFYFSQRNKFKSFLKHGGKKASFKMPLIYSIAFEFLLIAGAYGISNSIYKPLELEDNHFENQHISATIPEGWNAYPTDPKDSTIIYLEKDNGMANISIDNYQDFNRIPNSQTIKQFTPEEILKTRFESIEEMILENPDINWSNFRVNESVTTTDFKGLPAAEGSFIVDENILGERKETERIIERIVIFTNDDLYNIVFAATDSTQHPIEKIEFDKFLENLTIK